MNSVLEEEHAVSQVEIGKIYGDLTIRGVTKPLTLPFSLVITGEDAEKYEELIPKWRQLNVFEGEGVTRGEVIADGETVIQCMRAGANEFLLQPIKRTEFRDAMGRFERAAEPLEKGKCAIEGQPARGGEIAPCLLEFGARQRVANPPPVATPRGHPAAFRFETG